MNFKQEETVQTKSRISENPQNIINPEANIENIRAKNKEELDILTKELKDGQQILLNLETELEDFEEKKIKVEDDYKNIKILNIETQKQTENLEKMLNVISEPDQSEKKLEIQCKQIEDEIMQMQTEWANHKKGLLEKINTYKTKIEENKVFHFM